MGKKGGVNIYTQRRDKHLILETVLVGDDDVDRL